MKCVCGYEKLGLDWKKIPEQKIYYKTVSKSGQIKETVKEIVEEKDEYVDLDPENPEFILIKIEKDFAFIIPTEVSYMSDYEKIQLVACPKCDTVKLKR